ncbi:hypothetical protein [Intrasporangium sp.]|uniref:hypothetical protein n=1 Tax=Intrasporangium sp. TaxID=1925024 RepID=UPI003221A13A
MTPGAGRARRTFGLTVLGLYAACRVVTTLILLAVLPRQVPSGMTGGPDVPVTYWSFTALWDGQWYQQIALHGYPDVLPLGPDGHVQQNPWAFYPLFPLASRAVMQLTGLTFPTAGSTVALLCGFGAALLMGMLLRDRVGERAALVVVVLWASFPAAVTLQLAYSEALAMLLLVGYLCALDRRRWLVATAIALLIGLSRPIGVPLGLVTLVVVLVRWRNRGRHPIGTPEYASMAAALLGCAIAGLLWPAIAWFRTGSPGAYTDTMAAWRGSGHLELFTPWPGVAKWWLGDIWGPLLLAVIPLVIIGMVAGPWAAALRADLRAWSLAYPVYLAAVLDPFTSIVRYLVPLFPLLVPLVGAGWADRRGTTWRGLLARGVPLLVLCVVGQYWWTETLWRFVPPTDYPP